VGSGGLPVGVAVPSRISSSFSESALSPSLCQTLKLPSAAVWISSVVSAALVAAATGRRRRPPWRCVGRAGEVVVSWPFSWARASGKQHFDTAIASTAASRRCRTSLLSRRCRTRRRSSRRPPRGGPQRQRGRQCRCVRHDAKQAGDRIDQDEQRRTAATSRSRPQPPSAAAGSRRCRRDAVSPESRPRPAPAASASDTGSAFSGRSSAPGPAQEMPGGIEQHGAEQRLVEMAAQLQQAAT